MTIKNSKSDHSIFEDNNYISETLNACCLSCDNDANEDNEEDMKFVQSLNLKDRIFEKFLQANDLLNESDIKYTLKRFDSLKTSCACVSMKNSLKCCLKVLNEKKLNKSNASMDIFEYSCCKKCQTQQQGQFIPEYCYDDERKIKKAKDKFRRSFFGDVISSTDSSDGQEEIEDEKEKETLVENNVNSNLFHEAKSMDENLKISGPSVPTLDLNPPTNYKTIIKKSNFNNTDKKHGSENSATNKNGVQSARKTVQFIEDPKHGLVPVKIPEWQEKFREPVYSRKYSTSLPEWKK
jgi:hypothetical protein